MLSDFRMLVTTPTRQLDPSLAIAASRAGGLGILDLEYITDVDAARRAMARLERYAKGPYGIKSGYHQEDLLSAITGGEYSQLALVILSIQGVVDHRALQCQIEAIQASGRQVFLEISNGSLASLGESLAVDGLVAKGQEAGGYVGEETTFVLLQHCLSHTSLAVYAHGGIGLHTAAACYAAGAAGIVLDAQLALARESALPQPVKAAIAEMDGSETVSLGGNLGQACRVFSRPHMEVACQLADEATTLDGKSLEDRKSWLLSLEHCIGWGSLTEAAWPLGQDAAFASPLAQRYGTVGGILEAFRHSVQQHVEAATATRPLDAGSSLAQSHRTRYPIVQGPMTRVSDIAQFALDVAEAGGLPFLALALMRKEQALPVLEETKGLLGDHPWGVGILGFVPAGIRAEQLEAIGTVGPDFAIIAGGRPDQARALEQEGTSTYLHVPSPGLLSLFLAEGAKRFIFEGRECGGHVGPRSSFVLWNLMIDVLVQHLEDSGSEPAEYHVLFAGGVHDSLSSLMVSSLAATLAERGVRLGVLMGTAYLFTEEAVSSGAIKARYQREAIESRNTVVVETGIGHVTRCLPTPFVDAFTEKKRSLVREGADSGRVRDELEYLNVGRLRMASKGINRNPVYGEKPEAHKYVELDEKEQHEQGMYMIGQVAGLRDQVCTIEELHREVSVNGSQRLESLAAGHVQPVAAGVERQPARIAIVGISTVLPGAENLQVYWENILDKVDAISEIPAERFDWKRYYDPDKSARDKIYSRWGGFIDDVPLNPLDYGMPPNSIPSIEPMQLLMLEVVRGALEDAGYLDRPFSRERTSVVMAVGGGLGDLGFNYGVRSYLPHLLSADSQEVIDRLDDILPEWTEDSFPGILLNVLAGRISNRFDLNGPNLVVDAACGSSLAALDVALKDLETHRTDVAIVGGADTVQSPFGFLAFSKTQALSPRGRCRPFDVDADGIVISEGLAAVVLKRLDDAERDGDRIYAVIQGVGSSSDGRDRSLTAPRPLGQLLALQRAYQHAGFEPATVGLIEAHGTGTRLGDEVEAQALATLFNETDLDRPTCGVGSVKSMIGHTKSTAGLAGMIKVALGLYHKVLPPTLADAPNPTIGSNGSPVYVNSMARPWLTPDSDVPRRAGVSAFGFGGTNFHAALEEYRDDFLPRRASRDSWPAESLLFRAADSDGLVAQVSALDDWLADGNEPPLRNLAYTLYRKARDFGQNSALEVPLTLAIVASSLGDLRQKLQGARRELEAGSELIDNPQGIYFARKPLGISGKVAFLYPGQGSQYPNMLADLVMQFPQLGEPFEIANGVLADHLPKPLSEFVFPVPAHDDETAKAQHSALTDTRVAQPALGAAGLAMSQFVEEAGLVPDFVAGHSYGEIVALCRAGVIDGEALYAISSARGRFMAEATGPDAGTMAAVLADQLVVEEVLGDHSGVVVANLNSPKQTVISGATAAVNQAVASFGERGIRAKTIPVACAFHSPLVEPAQIRLAQFLDTIEFRSPELGVYSNTLGRAYPEEASEIREVLSKQLAHPVRFQEEIEALYRAGVRIFVETGPRGVLTGLVHQTLADQAHLAVAMDSGGPGLLAMQRAFSQLIAIGSDIDLGVLYDGRELSAIDLDRPYEDPAQEAFGPTTWLINGGRARRWLDAKDGLPEPILQPVDVSLAGAQMDTLPEPVPTATQPLAAGLQGDEATQVMLQTQQLMSRFLETQANVMRAYLGDDTLTGSIIQVPETPDVVEGQADYPAAAAQAERPFDPARGAVCNNGIGTAKPTGQASDVPPAIGRFLVDAVDAPLIDSTAGLAPGRVILITADRYGVADVVAGMLRDQGYTAVILADEAAGSTNGHGKRAANAYYLAGRADAEGIRTLLEMIRQDHGAIGSLLHLAALRPGKSFESMDLDEWQQAIEDDLVTLFHCVKELHEELADAARAGGACLLAATQMGGAFATTGGKNGFDLSHAGMAGLLKTAAHELPLVRAKVVDFSSQTPVSELVRSILAEIGADDGLTEVGYVDGVRTTLGLRAASVGQGEAPTFVVDEDFVILVTGGARGITASVVQELAECYRPTVILLGRSDAPPDQESLETAELTSAREIKRALLGSMNGDGQRASLAEVEAAYRRLEKERAMRRNLARLEKTGATVEYHSVDVCNEADLAALIDDVYDRFGRLDGVIHGAGIVEDKLIKDKRVDSLRRVVSTKVDCAFVLSRKLRPETLKFLVFFSSVSGRFGNRGQGDYAAANEVLNKLALHLDREWPGRVVSINWGPWDAGMVSDELRRQFLQRGVSLVPVDVGCRRFIEELNGGCKGDAEVLICGEDNQVMARVGANL
ncbi:MAG: SDR family NAD(P)-dependent oxidoreductase [Chloroflexota bacterium]|nr:SDR family NAD(P)-dependent oxidoreductase [Chloroflexota bacterium]